MRVALPLLLTLALAVSACGGKTRVIREAPAASGPVGDLYPNETPELRRLIRAYAGRYQVPESLVHRVIQRESDYRANARNGPYYGLMQILPETARTMGFRGDPAELLDAETNLMWAGRYLRGAWIVADGDIDEAVMWYARGYYYEARDRCLLVATGLRDRELRC